MTKFSKTQKEVIELTDCGIIRQALENMSKYKYKCDVCGEPARIAEIANGFVYGAICDDCQRELLEDADEFASMPA